MNAKKEVLELAKEVEEELEAIVVEGELFDKKHIEEGLAKIDYEFDSGYGGEEGPTIYAWTGSLVILKGVYDGSEWYASVPRNPVKQDAHAVGG